MKISKEEKERNFRKIVEAGVRVISKVGFKAATMRDISKAASLSDATIYKYFESKEALLHAYFEIRMKDLAERLKLIPDFEKFTLQEQLHSLAETNFELFAKDRTFVKIAYENVFATNWLSAADGSQKTKDLFFKIMEELIQAAVDVQEIPEPPYLQFLYELFWDYFVGIHYYWLKDETEGFTKTTQFLDKSLALVTATLQSGILNHGTELVHFLVREHLLSRMKQSKRNLNFEKAKRKFMSGEREKS